MILSQPDLRRAVQASEIAFDPPLEERQWGAASIDLRLGHQFTQLKNAPGMKLSVAGGLAHIGGFWKTMTLPPVNELGQQNTFCLEPGAFILALTHESISVPNNPRELTYGAKPGDSFSGQSHPLAKRSAAHNEAAERVRNFKDEWDR